MRSAFKLGAVGAIGFGFLASWFLWTEKTPVSGHTETASGLSILVPEGRTFAYGEAEIVMSNPGAYRTDDYIALYLNGLPDVPDYSADEVIASGDDPATFEVRRGGGGSGGPDFVLTTSKVVDGKTIDLLAVLQVELLGWRDHPDFAEAWAVWESLEPAAKDPERR